MVHLPHLIQDLALILGAAALTTLLFKRLRQPLVLGYLLAGLLVGPNFPLFPTITDGATIRIWAEIGVIILLFNLGLEFSFKKLAQVGGAAGLTGIVEISAMLATGFLVGRGLGWTTLDSVFLGGIVAISSTTIIFRAFDELGVKTQQFTSLVFGILVVEDLVAILLMVILSTVAVSQTVFETEMVVAVLKLVFFLTIWFLGGIFLVPSLLRSASRLMNDETLLIVALGLCLGMVILVTQVGFSPALGAFMMGSILAETLFVERIEHLLKPIRDLFGAIFFVSVGMLIEPAMLVEYAGPILLLVSVVIVGKALFAGVGALLAGQSLRNALQTGMSLTQIGEFSFIIATLGQTLKVTSDFLYPIAVAVSALTTFTTPYLIRAANPLYDWLTGRLSRRTQWLLNRYSAKTQTISGVSDWRLLVRSFFQNLLVNGVVLICIIVLASRVLLPALEDSYPGQWWPRFLTGTLALIVMLPFLWALAFRPVNAPVSARLSEQRNLFRTPLWIMTVSRVLLAVALLLAYVFLFSPLTSRILVLGVLGLVGWMAGRRIPLIYELMERQFLLNLNARQRQQEARPGRNLRPWDAHLSYVEVSPESTVVGKNLAELALREEYGINIVCIERGAITRLVPNRFDQLLPGDKLAVIGTDAQLERLRPLVETPETALPGSVEDSSLQQIQVGESSSLVGQSIRSSSIREHTQGLVVGIERRGERILNPESTFVFLPGDILWLAGNTRLIRAFTKGRT